jgi:hypothetical protein
LSTWAKQSGKEPLPIWDDVQYFIQMHDLGELDPTKESITLDDHVRAFLKQFQRDGDDIADKLREVKGLKPLYANKKLGTSHKCSGTVVDVIRSVSVTNGPCRGSAISKWAITTAARSTFGARTLTRKCSSGTRPSGTRKRLPML